MSDKLKLAAARSVIAKKNRLLLLHDKIFDLVFLKGESVFSQQIQDIQEKIMQSRKESE